MHGIYNYIPQTKHVSTVYNVTAVLWFLNRVHAISNVINVLYLYISNFRTMCAVPYVAFFCSSSMGFSAMLFRYFLNDFDIIIIITIIIIIIIIIIIEKFVLHENKFCLP
jgi:hypothetical protein